MQGGAAAISMTSSRGALMNDGNKLVAGRLYGQSLFPRSLDIVHSAAMIGMPIIAGGGVWTEQDAADMLSAGAMAVEIDASLWVPREASA